jgi:6-phosphogluconolactonase
VRPAGADAHTASLFPSSPALHATGWATAATAPPDARVRDRVSLTLAAIGVARVALILVSGEDKAAAVAASLRAHPDDPAAPPAARVRALGSTVWLLDTAAAGPDSNRA